MNALKSRRRILRGQITRVETYFTNYGSDSTTLEQVHERVNKLVEYFREFETVQTEIELLDENDLESQELERTAMEEKYYNAKSLGARLVQQLSRDNSPIQTETIPSNRSEMSNSDLSNAVRSLLEHQTVLADLVSQVPTRGNTASQNVGQSEIRLQPITVPTFNGNFKDWPEFHDLFRNLVHNNNRFSPAEKLQYLKRSLIGNAQGILKNISISDANYTEAYEELINTFNKKDVIIDSYFQIIMDQQKVYSVSAETLRSLCSNINESIRALKALELPTEHWDRWLIFVLCSKLDNESLKLWRRSCAQQPSSTEIKFADLITFINNRIYELSPMKQTSSEVKQPIKNNVQFRQKYSHATVATVNTCFMCDGQHGVYSCQKFLQLSTKSRREFIQKKGLCFNCIKGKHFVKDCTSKSMCRYCQSKHNSLLHEHKSMNNSNNAYNGSMDKQLSLHNKVESHTIKTTILPTAVVLIRDKFNTVQECRILLDTGSQVNLITEKCMQRLKLNRFNARMLIKGVGMSELNNTRGKVKLTLQSRFNTFTINTEAFILQNVTSNIPTMKVQHVNSDLFKDIQLADPNYFSPNEIDMIVGSDIFFQILESGKRSNGPGTTMVQETKFGWIVSGQGLTGIINHRISLHSCISIDQSLKRFWEVEELTSTPSHTDEEMEVEEHFINNVKRNDEGRYIVRLPFKRGTDDRLGTSRNNALNTLNSLERRFAQNPNLKVEYTKFINEYLELNHMKEVPEHRINLSSTECFYLPHHAVFKESSSTTKLRVVFDASRKSSTGNSLNNLLLVGPTIQRDIRSLLLNFRKYKIAYTADITKMYRQIYVDPQDTPFQRILWRDSVVDKIKEYELQTVTYGTSCAPFLAIRCLKQLAIDEGDKFKLGAEHLLENFYVDDFMGGSHTVEHATAVRKEVSELLAKGGFEIRKWSSNSEEFLSSINEKLREVSFSLPLQEDTTVKVLGLRWHAAWDSFTFEVNLESQNALTKRIILSEISKIFDPLGLLGPCIIVAKLIMQELWISGVGWDDQLPDKLINKYINFREDLRLLTSVKIKRHLKIVSNSLVQICGFADASEVAYAAVIYIRTITNGDISVTLLTSKTRVAPIKQISLPRLELCAAHLLAELLSKVRSTMFLENSATYAFTDSTVVLAWLQAIPRKWKTFIANRTSRILDVIPFSNWHHVRSADNAADPASRGLLTKEIINCDLWWNGPSFLYTQEFEKVINTNPLLETNLECRLQTLALNACIRQDDTEDMVHESFSGSLFKRYSSLQKLVAVFAMCKRFIFNLQSAVKKSGLNKSTTVQFGELQNSMIHLIKMAQIQDLAIEIKLIKNQQPLSKGNKLLSLNPFIDGNNVLRVGGRLQEANISYSRRHPIILMRNNDLARLIVKDVHKRYFHANQQLMSNVLVMKYWIIGGRGLVKKIIRECTICMRYRMEPYNQQMGNLPSYRVRQCRPFTNTGTDFAGPFMIKTWHGRAAKQLKCYIAIFVCMSTRAIHIELVADLTSNKFLAALQRFVSRRGICSNLYSDNGRNFIGAARKISEMQDFLRENQSSITRELAKDEISWHFIPAYSPNFGGIWESAVKAMKYHMKRVIGEVVLTYDEMTTLLCQIEACLNSRPINVLNLDAEDPEPLTPGHFLTQGPILLPPQEETDDHMSLSTRWRLVQHIHQSFWRKWSHEYLVTLQQRKKWAKPAKNIQLNDIVLIKEDNLPPCSWLMGRVIGTKPGRDGLVRVATVKTKKNIIERSIRKLIVFLPIELD